MAAKPSVLKRQRERKRAEKAAQKREERVRRDANRPEGAGTDVATREDLEGYGIGSSFIGGDDTSRRR
jgi:hypothetical protein